MLESQRGEKLRHAMCGLLVEILSPVSAVIKYEASIPAVRKLVQTLYPHSFEHSKRQRHSLVCACKCSLLTYFVIRVV